MLVAVFTSDWLVGWFEKRWIVLDWFAWGRYTVCRFHISFLFMSRYSSNGRNKKKVEARWMDALRFSFYIWRFCIDWLFVACWMLVLAFHFDYQIDSVNSHRTRHVARRMIWLIKETDWLLVDFVVLILGCYSWLLVGCVRCYSWLLVSLLLLLFFVVV